MSRILWWPHRDMPPDEIVEGGVYYHRVDEVRDEYWTPGRRFVYEPVKKTDP